MDAAWIKKELEAVDFTTSQANALALVLSQMATKADLDALRQHMDGELTGLRQHVDRELSGLRQHVDGGLSELRQHVDAGFKEVYQEIGQIWWKMAVLLTLQAGLIVSLIKLI